VSRVKIAQSFKLRSNQQKSGNGPSIETTGGSLADKRLSKLQDDLGEVKRMLKALIKSLENKPLNP